MNDQAPVEIRNNNPDAHSSGINRYSQLNLLKSSERHLSALNFLADTLTGQYRLRNKYFFNIYDIILIKG
jgi:hypothetical protein